jgi:hypothetical protein
MYVDEIKHCFQKEKRRKWVFGRLKNKRFLSIEAPPTFKGTNLCESEEEHSKHALSVATAAAEAALTAAQVAVEVVRLQSAHQFKRKPEQVKTNCEWKIEESSAIKIQTAFRGYLVSFLQAFTFHLYDDIHKKV